VERAREPWLGGPEPGAQQRLDLGDREGEVGGAELEHLPLAAQAVDRERRLRARGQDEVEHRRCLPAEALDQSRRPCGRRDLVHVVEHEDQVMGEVLGQRRAEQAAERLGVQQLVARHAGRRARRDREVGELGHLRAQRSGDADRQRGQRPVARGHRVPGAVDVGGPGGKQARLAEAGIRRDDGQAPGHDGVEASLQRGPREPAEKLAGVELRLRCARDLPRLPVIVRG
jgi:hypothetical protein